MINDVRVDHGGLYVGMAQQFMDGTNVRTRFQQMCREALTKHVAGGELTNLGRTNRTVYVVLHISWQ